MKKNNTFSTQAPRLFPQVQFNRNDLQYHLIFWLILSVLHYINFAYTTLSPSDNQRNDGFIDMLLTLVITLPISYVHTYYLLPRTFGDTRMSISKAALYYFLFAIIFIALTCSAYSYSGSFLKDRGILKVAELAHDWIRTLPEIIFNMYLLTGLVYLRKWFHSSVEISLQRDLLAKEKQYVKQSERADRYKILALNWRMPHHFLFNCLNTIYVKIIKNPSAAQENVIKLRDTMEYLTYDCREPKVSLVKEIELLKNYLEMALDGIPKDKYELNATFEEVPDSTVIAPLLLIPFVENAIKHGIESSESRKWVKLHLKVDEHNVLHLKIKNSQLIEADVSRLSFKSGLGIADTRQRLKLAYPNGHELSLDSDGDVFKMVLKIELNKLNIPL